MVEHARTDAAELVVKRILGTINAPGRATALPSLLDHIDKTAETIGRELGGQFFHAGWTDLGWFFLQYRGTVLSGERAFSNFFHSAGLGTRRQNEVLLAIYWGVFGLGSTLGELFEQRCVSQELVVSRESVALRKGIPDWRSLVVTKTETVTLRFEPHDDHQPEELYIMEVPRTWAEALVPDDFQTVVEGIAKAYARKRNQDARTFVRDAPQFQKLKIELLRRRVKLLADVAWAESGEQSPSVAASRRFLEPPSAVLAGTPAATDELVLRNVLGGVQLLCLYWQWATCHGLQAGPLAVCVPKPGNGDPVGLQPRLGFAAVSVACLSPTDIHRQLQRICRPWREVLNESARLIDGCGAPGEAEVLDRGKRIDRPDKMGGSLLSILLQNMSELHLGRMHGALLLLQRLLPLLGTLDAAVPDLVHEGRRFGVSILLGLPYHEQVLGEELGDVKEHLDLLLKSHPVKVARLTRDKKASDHVALLTVLAKSCYSLLDWEGVVLFGRWDPNALTGIRFTSLRRLPSVARGLPPSLLYRDLTLRNRELLAVAVDRAGAIRVYLAGTFLLYRDKRGWQLGSTVEGLKKLLVDKLTQMGVAVAGSTVCLDSFISLLLRISEEPGAGAMFVIPRKPAYISRLSTIAPPPEPIWKNLRPFALDPSGAEYEERHELLYRLAVMDGATAVIPDFDNPRSFEGQWRSVSISPRLLVNEKFKLARFQEVLKLGSWAQWPDILTYGAKHSSAFALAMESHLRQRPILVVTVSADGPISFMLGGEDPVTRWPGRE